MKLKESTVNKLEYAFSIGASVLEACYCADISRQTFYNWINDNKKLKAKFDRLKQKPILKARKTIEANLDLPEIARWYLEKKRKTEFGNVLKLESDGGEERKRIEAIEKILIKVKDERESENTVKPLLQE